VSRREFWINQAFFQASWPACVGGAAFGLLWPGLLVVGAFAAWQLHPRHAHPADPAALVLFVGLGAMLDTLWVRLGVVDYALDVPAAGFAPLWLLLLWVALALTANHSLLLFRRRWVLFALIATVGSPMSYTAAAGLGAVDWTAPAWVVVVCMGPVWALLTGLAFRAVDRIASRWHGERNTLEAIRG